MGLGSYPLVSLADARGRATEARTLLKDGHDPLEVRRSKAASDAIARGHTFRAAADDLLADKARGWKNAKHRWQWRATLEKHVFPVFGDWPVQKVDTEAVLGVLRPLWFEIPETAKRLRGRIEAVLDSAKAKDWRTGENPARWKGHLAQILPSPRQVRAVAHQPALPWQQVPSFVAALRERPGVVARALEFLVLTAARSGEVRGMRWGEVDLNAGVWMLPAARMKAGKLHRVPLSQAALAILRKIRPETVAADTLVFPGSAPGKPLSDMSLTAVVRRMNAVPDGQDAPWRDPGQGEPIVVHGFRSTFRVWAGECTHYAREVVEAALAHTLTNKVEAAYARTDYLDKRRPLMDEWAAHCERLPPGPLRPDRSNAKGEIGFN